MNPYRIDVSDAKEQIIHISARPGQRVIIDNLLPPNSGDAILTYESGKTSQKSAEFVFQVPDGTQWSDLHLTEIDPKTIEARIGKVVRRYNFEEIDCRDKRRRKKNLPNKQWEALILLIQNKGEITWNALQRLSSLRGPKMLMCRLAKILRSVFPFQDKSSPFHPFAKHGLYKAKFDAGDISRDDFSIVTNPS